MGSCCYVLCGCMNGASPVRFVQMNPVCVVCCVLCVWLHLIEVCLLFVTEVTNPNGWSVCLCVSSGQDLIRRPPLL